MPEGTFNLFLQKLRQEYVADCHPNEEVEMRALSNELTTYLQLFRLQAKNGLETPPKRFTDEVRATKITLHDTVVKEYHTIITTINNLYI